MSVIQNITTIDGEEVVILIETDDIILTDENEWRGDDDSEEGERRKDSKIVESARDLFGEGLRLAQSCAIRVVDSMKTMNEAVKPHEVELQLGIKLDTEVGAVLAKTSTEAQIQITLTWEVKARS